MDYVFELAIPAETARTDAVVEELSLPKGMIQRVAIYFPWGCKNLAHVSVWHNEHQLWPSNPDRDYSGNELLLEFPENYELKSAWSRFTVRGWNEDDTYSHTPVIWLTVLEEKTPFWARTIFGRLFGGGR